MGKKLFVGGLSWDTTDETLRAAFESFGAIADVRVIRDRETGKSRGFGFVSFINDPEAINALTAMDGAEVDGRRIRVNEAEDKRGPGDGGAPSRGAPRPGDRGGYRPDDRGAPRPGGFRPDDRGGDRGGFRSDDRGGARPDDRGERPRPDDRGGFRPAGGAPRPGGYRSAGDDRGGYQGGGGQRSDDRGGFRPGGPPRPGGFRGGMGGGYSGWAGGEAPETGSFEDDRPRRDRTKQEKKNKQPEHDRIDGAGPRPSKRDRSFDWRSYEDDDE